MAKHVCKAPVDRGDLLGRAFSVILACLNSFEDCPLSMAWSRATFCSSHADSYSVHAAAEGLPDLYVPLHPKEEVVVMKASEGWALVAKFDGMVGWTPEVFLSDLARM